MNSPLFNVRAQALAFGGGIVCDELDGAEPRKVFVGGLIPGEEAKVRPIEQSSNLVHGQLVQISKASPDRRIAPCQYFDQCGGCNLQYMTIEAQRSAKIGMIASMLQRQAGLSNLPNVVDCSAGLPEFAYRRRVTLHLALDGRLGFYRRGTREAIPIEHCIISEDLINATIKELHPFAHRLAPFIASIEVDVSAGKAIVCKLRDRISPYRLSGLEKVWKKFGHVRLKYKGKDLVYQNGQFIPAGGGSIGHFSQVNRFGNDRLVSEVMKRAKGSHATELYAGAGNFTFPLAERGFSVDAVELSESLVKAGQATAWRNKVQTRVRFHQRSCENFVRHNALRELVILDPPRAGCLEVVRKGRWDDVTSIIYISCSLPSLGRDLKVLVQDKKFTIKELLFVDMFPQTHHTEIIAVLEKTS